MRHFLDRADKNRAIEPENGEIDRGFLQMQARAITLLYCYQELMRIGVNPLPVSEN
jgi:hypothetical protein